MIKAWHFVGDKLRDGCPIPKDGVWLEYCGHLKMCVSGLHASKDPFDALQYAPGSTLCKVECAGTIIEGDDKLVCSKRRIVARMDFEEPLRYFARMQALSVIHLYDAPDVVLDYLMTGDKSLRAAAWAAARDAAWDAANAAARAAASAAAWDAANIAASDAANAAARDAASAAAWDAANAAARDAASDAANAAAWAAARDAASDAANIAASDAANAAARDAANAAARAAAGKDFNTLVRECFEQT